ncbi:cytochrome P450 4C1-like isoform X7 [Dermacentor silvarum]|uniref:cytochrome P450 4C1-like isoform X5 n=1 Tax=Dermacentor silvarum TaxID=543639 RepID=UPI002100D9C7|nr:cytochrome P450 4C1-like isoform X5 [Dermacentor silvarum]XP_049516184.1 cytochrome P450 4C1-like isoform X6 [Dermacentor silvarum]XP_049516185.1 cytochrome P450 4C1-like isoform X7 [Dermacentor silvarum]
MATTAEAFSFFAYFVRVWIPYSLLLCLVTWLFGVVRQWWNVRQALKPLPGPPDAVPFWTMLKMYRSRRSVITQKTAGTEFSYLLRALCEMYKNRTFKTYLGFSPFVIIQNPEDAEVLLSSSENLRKPLFYTFTIPWLGPRNMLYIAGNVWRFKRKLQMPAFHSKTLEKFMDVVNEHADSMVERMEEASVKKELAPIQNIVKRCSLDLIGEVLMGVNLNTQKNQNSQYSEYISGVTFLMAVRAFRPWMWLNTIYNISMEGMWFRKMISGINEFNLKIMSERKKTFHLYRNQGDLSGSEDEEVKDNRGLQPERRMAVIDIMLDKHFKDPSYTMHEIRKDLDLLLFAGHDTTSIAMAWTLYLLGLHPELQRKVQEELDAIFMDDFTRDVTRDDTDRMVFLEACFKEAMRLFPPIPFIGRVLDESIKLDGVVIPKGTTVFINIFGLHRNDNHFEKSEEFIPARFLDGAEKKRHPFAFIPFSAGAKNCIGQRFAYRQGKVVLAKVLLRYTFKASWPLDRLKVSTEMVTKVKGGLRVWVRRRKPGQYA